MGQAMTESPDKQPTFEQALDELEQLVEKMESGDLSLDESLASFERGIALTRTCQQSLKAAEQKVEILSSNDPNGATEPFQVQDDA